MAALDHIRWPVSIVTGGRFGSEYASKAPRFDVLYTVRRGAEHRYSQLPQAIPGGGARKCTKVYGLEGGPGALKANIEFSRTARLWTAGARIGACGSVKY